MSNTLKRAKRIQSSSNKSQKITEDYNKITLNLYDEIITLTPSKLYWVADEDIPNHYNQDIKYMVKIVVYNITYTDKNNITKSAVIPYYVSDGYTNQLRVNMLYPFMSFNIYNNVNSPYVDLSLKPTPKYTKSGLIFKYQIGRNIDYNEILENIKTEFLKNNKQADLDKVYSDENGLKTIFERLANFLDYVIGLSSCKISDTDTDDDVISYRPLTDHIKSYTLPNDTDDRKKFDMKCINTPLLQTSLTAEDNYRKCIIPEIRKSRECLNNSKLFKIESITLDINECTRTNFNDTMEICIDKRYNININNYVDISIKFHHNIRKYIYQLQITKELDDIMNKELNDLQYFGIILYNYTDIDINNFNNTLNEMAKRWKTKCFVVSIKYDDDDDDDSRLIKNHRDIKSLNSQSPIINYDIRAVNGNIINDDEYLYKLYIEYKHKYDYIKRFKNKNKNIDTNTCIVKELYLIYFNEYLAYKKYRLQEIDKVKKEYVSIKDKYLKINALPSSIEEIEKQIKKIEDYLKKMIINPIAYMDLLNTYNTALKQIKQLTPLIDR
jgi:hypothetical protein